MVAFSAAISSYILPRNLHSAVTNCSNVFKDDSDMKFANESAVCFSLDYALNKNKLIIISWR